MLCMRSSLVDSSTEIFRGQHEPCCFITVFLPRHLWEAGVFTSFFLQATKKDILTLTREQKSGNISQEITCPEFFVAEKPTKKTSLNPLPQELHTF